MSLYRWYRRTRCISSTISIISFSIRRFSIVIPQKKGKQKKKGTPNSYLPLLCCYIRFEKVSDNFKAQHFSIENRGMPGNCETRRRVRFRVKSSEKTCELVFSVERRKVLQRLTIGRGSRHGGTFTVVWLSEVEGTWK